MQLVFFMKMLFRSDTIMFLPHCFSNSVPSVSERQHGFWGPSNLGLNHGPSTKGLPFWANDFTCWPQFPHLQNRNDDNTVVSLYEKIEVMRLSWYWGAWESHFLSSVLRLIKALNILMLPPNDVICVIAVILGQGQEVIFIIFFKLIFQILLEIFFLYCELDNYDDTFASFGYVLIYSEKAVKIYCSLLITLFCHFFIMI